MPKIKTPLKNRTIFLALAMFFAFCFVFVCDDNLNARAANVASSEPIAMTLIEYNSFSGQARIRIENIGFDDYRNVRLFIDDGEHVEIVGLLESKSAIIIPRVIKPGTHRFTITDSDELMVSKEIVFPKSVEHIMKENEEKKRAEAFSKIVKIFALVIFGVIIFFAIKYIKKYKNKT